MKNISATATLKTVQPKTTYNYMLDEDRIVEANLRLNNFGRLIITRHHVPNPQLLLTQPGFTWFRTLGAVRVENNGKTSRTRVNRLLCEKYARAKFYDLVDLTLYSDFIAKMYSKPENISFRSVFEPEKYFEMLNKYGWNRKTKIPADVVTRMIGLLDKYMRAWISNPQFEFSLKDFIETGKWLSHIKTNSNSGYPDNIKQDKATMTKYASQSLKVFEDFSTGKPINWAKLPFEMGYRTERKGKHRVICMAPTIEKILSSVLSTWLDVTAKDLPFNLPRKFGGTAEQFAELKKYDGAIITKDFEAYDTSIPLHLFEILLSWFKNYDNTISKIIQFELSLIIHSFMVIDSDKIFHIASLPSGIGVTQFIGSLIHWLLDLTFELQCTFAMYQSDDNIARTKLSLNEVNACLKTLTEATHMVVSPMGEKSSYNLTTGRFLQKIMDFDHDIFYNHEQRGYTNALFRERQVDDDTVFNILFEANDKDSTHKKMVLAYLGNIVSFGQRAPSLPNIMSFLYGKNSGFTVTQIKWGLTNLEKYMEVYLEQEQHRAKETAGWTTNMFNTAIDLYGWNTVPASKFAGLLQTM